MNKLFKSFSIILIATNIFTANPTTIKEAAEVCQIPQHVGSWVKYWITYTSDGANKDRWQSAEETFRTRKGDCEDYAILAIELLKELGVKGQLMHFTFYKGKNYHGHAICVFKENGKYNFIGTSGYNNVQVNTLKEVGIKSMQRYCKHSKCRFTWFKVYTERELQNAIS